MNVAADSGQVKTHAFCPSFGTPVYLRFGAMPDLIAVAAASLDAPERVALQVLTYRLRRLAWDGVDGALRSFDRRPDA